MMTLGFTGLKTCIQVWLLLYGVAQSSRQIVRYLTSTILKSFTRRVFVASLSTMSLTSSYLVVSCPSSLSALFFYSRTVTTVLDSVSLLRLCLLFLYTCVSENKCLSCWNFTSGFDFRVCVIIGMPFGVCVPNFVQMGPSAI